MKRQINVILITFIMWSLLGGNAVAMASEKDPEQVVGNASSVLHGTNTPGSTLEETELGDVVADSVRSSTNSDIAMIPGGIIAHNIQGGSVTQQELSDVFYDDHQVVTTTVTPSELFALMEHGVSKITVGEGDRIDQVNSSFEGFPQISGFSYVCDASAPTGDRILSITLNDGTSLDPGDQNTTIMLATTEDIASGSFGYTAISGYQLQNYGVKDCLTRYFDGNTVEVPKTNRSNVIGAADNSIVSQIPAGTFTVAVFVMIACTVCFKNLRKQKEFNNGLG